MSADAKLTILLTLKGRHLFTLRWLWHANRIKLPFAILIADGEVNSPIAHLIEDRSLFPNLLIEYHRYNDATFLNFYQKISDELSKVKTPYTMFADNDDFLFPSGIKKSISFMERSPDYVCAGGGTAHFETEDQNNAYPNLSGQIKSLWYQQRKAYQSYDLNSSYVLERVCDVYRDNLTVWYNIYKTEALHRMASEMVQYNFTKLERCELFHKLRSATLGKMKSDNSYISYIRQMGTSLNPAAEEDFLNTLVNELYIEESQAIVKNIASIAASIDGVELNSTERELVAFSAAYLRSKLEHIFGWRTALKLGVKKHLPKFFIQRTKGISDRIRSGKGSAAGGRSISRQRIFELMASAGAPGELLGEQRNELAEIEATLRSSGLVDFVRLHAPSALLQNK